MSSTAWSANGATISIRGGPPRSGNRVYGRGTADNKGQHSINLSALARRARGARRPARLQCQIHRRDGRGDRLAGFARRSANPCATSSRPICFWPPTGRGCPRIGPRYSSAAAAEYGFISTSTCATARIIPAIGAACWPIPRPSSPARSPRWSTARGVCCWTQLKPPRISNQVRADAWPTSRSSRRPTSRRCRRIGARRACRPPSGSMPGTRSKCWRCRRAISKSRPTPFRDSAQAVLQLRFVVGTRVDKAVDAVRAHLQRQRAFRWSR